MAMFAALYADPVSDAIAEESGPPGPPLVEWATVNGEPQLVVDGPAGATGTLRYRAMLGNIDHYWTESFELDEAGVATIPMDSLDDEAFLDEQASLDYVTDVSIMVTVRGIKALAPLRHVAWPDGQTGEPAIWSPDEMRTEAPNGVLVADLRALVDDEPGARLHPSVGSEARTRGDVDTGVER